MGAIEILRQYDPQKIPAQSVESTSSMLPPASPAISDGFCIIDPVMHWFYGPEKCEDRP
jgi:hypothetical protein